MHWGVASLDAKSSKGYRVFHVWIGVIPQEELYIVVVVSQYSEMQWSCFIMLVAYLVGELSVFQHELQALGPFTSCCEVQYGKLTCLNKVSKLAEVIPLDNFS